MFWQSAQRSAQPRQIFQLRDMSLQSDLQRAESVVPETVPVGQRRMLLKKLVRFSVQLHSALHSVLYYK